MANHTLTVAEGQRGVAVNDGRLIVDAGDTFVVTEEEYESLSALIAQDVLIDEGTTEDDPTYGGSESGSGEVPEHNHDDSYYTEAEVNQMLIGVKKEHLLVAASDETTDLTTGDAKVTFRMPFTMNPLQEVRASLTTPSSDGPVAVDVTAYGSTIFSTPITIDEGDDSSVGADVEPVLSETLIGDHAEIVVNIDAAGTGAKGLKLTFIGTRT
jgi:hypothetical protein